MRKSTRLITILAAAPAVMAGMASFAMAQTDPEAGLEMGPETETFDGGQFTNPIFAHEFEWAAPMWEIVDPFKAGEFVLHLIPNNDNITFNLGPGQSVSEIRIDFRDHEVNFFGKPSSRIWVYGASGDLLEGVASELMIWETFSFSPDDLGLNTGLPIGDIVKIRLNAPNSFQGAFFDNISINVVDVCYADCDSSTGAGVLDVFDFLCFQNSFVSSEPYACDCDTSTGPAMCDVFDFLCFQDAFVGGCP